MENSDAPAPLFNPGEVYQVRPNVLEFAYSFAIIVEEHDDTQVRCYVPLLRGHVVDVILLKDDLLFVGFAQFTPAAV